MTLTRRPLPLMTLALAAALALGACSKAPPSPPPPLPGPQATPPAPPPPTAAVTAPEFPLNCNESAVTALGLYMAENNAWGKGDLQGWSQCMGVGYNSAGGFAARWTWDWPEGKGNVKAYPEIVFGHKPGYPQSSNTVLPRKLSQIQRAQLSYEVSTVRYGAGNMAVDMWLSSTDRPDTFTVPPISHEIMVWLDHFGPMYAGGQQVDQVTLDGVPYRVYLGDKFGLGWRYVAFLPNIPLRPAARMDLKAFFQYLKGKGWIQGDEHLAAINFGNEIISGKGETRLNLLNVQID